MAGSDSIVRSFLPMSSSVKTSSLGAGDSLEKRTVEDGVYQQQDLAVTPEEDAAITRKIDMRLLIVLGALYAVSLIDRSNTGIARIAGMGRDLGLKIGERYSIITLVFFIPYTLFELPSNILLRKIGARTHLSALVTLWGCVMLGTAFITSWKQLAVCRVLLGLLESGFFPGCCFLISTWYTRYQTQKRLAVFYLTSMICSGLSNIMGYGIAKLNGTYGIAGWRWIYICFGAATIGLGLIAFFTIVDFPDRNTFLTAQETAHITSKIDADRGDGSDPDELSLPKVLRHLRDFKLWCFGLMFMSCTLPVYAFTFFLPVILAGGGFTVELSLVLSAPPYISAAMYSFAVAYASDKTHKRGVFIALNAMICTIGLLIMAFAGKIWVRYFGSFLAIAGAQDAANVPGILAWQANNILTHSKRSLASSLVIGFGGIGGILTGSIYREKDTPRYLNGLAATIACQGLILILTSGLSWYFYRKNKAVDKGKEVIEGREGFKYTL